MIGSSDNLSASSKSFGRSSNSTHPSLYFWRSFEFPVLELTQLNVMAAERPEVSSTREHTMPDVVSPGNARNELNISDDVGDKPYVTLWSGDSSQSAITRRNLASRATCRCRWRSKIGDKRGTYPLPHL